METLRAGILAYFDSFDGLIPCRVLSIDPQRNVCAQLTANRGAYKRGEVLESSHNWVVPRSSVYVRSGQYRIKSHLIEVTQI